MPAAKEPILESEGKLGAPDQPIIHETPPPEVDPAEKLKPGWVRVRVTKLGHGKVSKGETNLAQGAYETTPEGTLARVQPFPFHDKGDVLAVPKHVADSLEDRGFAEIKD